ncbi:WD40 repeat-like protein [Penicillium herquei]|nr:WD40 repeat-like protein [Penicillium herquei]
MPQRKRDFFRNVLHGRKQDGNPVQTANATDAHSNTSLTSSEAQQSLNEQQTVSAFQPSASTNVRGSSLWDKAYNQLRLEEKGLIDRYEKILSLKLQGSESEEPESAKNIIKQDEAGRATQMRRLMDEGLKRTESLRNAEYKMAPVVNIVASFRETVSGAVSSFTVPALAWCAVCIGLELVLNSISEAESYREGIAYVVSRMKWYSSLPLRISEKQDGAGDSFTESQLILEDEVLGLYKALLKHLIKSVCTLFRHKVSVVARNLVKFDDWEGALEELKTLEESVNRHSVDLDTKQTSFHTRKLVSLEVSKQDRDFIERFWVKDMANEIQNIQRDRGDLLEACYKWIIYTKEYNSLVDWQQDSKTGLLWIRGDAGKGKTMLLIGIVNELKTHVESHFGESMLSYFFCRGTDDSVSSAISVLRGLVWMILRQKASLITYFREELQGYDLSALRESSTFPIIKKAFLSMLKDPELGRVYLVVDALDECKSNLDELLELIRESSGLANVKWICASRNEESIEDRMRLITDETQLSLELNAQSVSEAVRQFIKFKVSVLGDSYKQKLPQTSAKLDTILENLENRLHEKAEKTFLWVALVMKQLQECSPDKILDRLALFPKGLSGVYTAMLKKMKEDYPEDVPDCKQVLLAMVNTLRPLHLSELVVLANLNEFAYHNRIVRQCGLLVFRDDNKTVQFVHQSAKDYLTQDLSAQDQAPDEVTVEVLHDIFPFGYSEGHRMIISNSLTVMGNLRKNIFDLQRPDCEIGKFCVPNPDPLESLRYSCQYWVDHLGQLRSNFEEFALAASSRIRHFLNAHFLHWVEALTLMQEYSVALSSISRLIQMLTESSLEPEFLSQLEDFHRFLQANRSPVETFPLQIYISAIMFSPTEIQKKFQAEMFRSIVLKSPMEPGWGACTQTIDYSTSGRADWAVSPDCKVFATPSFGKEIKIWDFETGRLLESFDGYYFTADLALSSDGRLSMTDRKDPGIKVRDLRSGKFLDGFEGFSNRVLSMCYTSQDYLATGHAGSDIRVWTADGTCLKILDEHDDDVTSIGALSGGKLVSGSKNNVIKIWDPSLDWKCVRTIVCSDDMKGISASRDDELFAAALGEKVADGSHTINIWCATDERSQISIDCHMLPSVSFILGPNKTIVSVTTKGTIEIWNFEGQHVQTLEGHPNLITPVSLVKLPDGRVASGGGWDQVVKVWNTSGSPKSLERHHGDIRHFFQSADGSSLLSVSNDGLVKFWDLDGTCLKDYHLQRDMQCLAYS